MPRYKQGSRKASSWVEALKIWNRQNKGVWIVPKRGSTEYKQVKAIQSKRFTMRPTRR